MRGKIKKAICLLLAPMLLLVSVDTLKAQQTQSGPGVKETEVLTTAEKDFVLMQSRKVDATIRARFDKRLKAWDKAILSNMRMMMSSSTYAYAELPEFELLQKMGKPILPLVMEKLLDSTNFRMIVLYEAVQPDTTLWVRDIFVSEQARSVKVVKRWVASQKRIHSY